MYILYILPSYINKNAIPFRNEEHPVIVQYIHSKFHQILIIVEIKNLPGKNPHCIKQKIHESNENGIFARSLKLNVCNKSPDSQINNRIRILTNIKHVVHY